ncbi:MAG: alpha-L-fucosidase [Planctomycetota bacterium]|jgi:alpha-L-fucosidase
MANIDWFKEARYGLFIHYGLYSQLGRGEWVMNRERIPVAEYEKLVDTFTAEKMDFDEIISRAKNKWGMKYAVLTTKHHEGFCLYDSKLTDYKSTNSSARRDLVQEFVDACRKHDMKVGLYHTLNDWHCSPNAVDALNDKDKNYQPFLDYVFGQLREIMTNYGKIDIMWYDGWWPYHGDGWQGEKMNKMIRELQPGILINGRNGANGDFDTPEQHITATDGCWEACMTLNNSWGFHKGDHDWKSSKTVIDMLIKCSQKQGNLLLNIGPKGDGAVPQESVEILDKAGEWLAANKDSIYGTERFDFCAHDINYGRGDWTNSGPFTANSDTVFWNIMRWPGKEFGFAGIKSEVKDVNFLNSEEKIEWKQDGERLIISGQPEERDCSMPVVIKITTESGVKIYNCGGYGVPEADHPRYDPLPSDIKY